MSKEEIIKKLRLEMPSLRTQYPIKELGIFGSTARGDKTPTSDIDILVNLSSPIGFFEFIRLEKRLGEILQSKVDLISRTAIKPTIKDDILKETIYV